MKRLTNIERLKYQLYFLFRIPLIFSVRPRIIRLDGEAAVVRINLRRRTKNHVGSMYLGALVVGADLAAGLLAVAGTGGRSRRVVPIFKDIKGDFIKRVESDALFVCRAGRQVAAMVDKCMETGERVTEDIPLDVYAAADPDGEVLASFQLGLSVKISSSR